MTLDEYLKKHGYDSSRYLGLWKGYEVHEPLMNPDDGIPVIGIPVFILCRGADVKLSTPAESMEIMDHFE
jgi:hypothetical protein